jgi:hypothetical protein
VEALLRRLVRLGIDRGVGGNGATWFALAATAYLMRRARQRSRAVVTSMPISPGQRIEVRLWDPAAPGAPTDV